MTIRELCDLLKKYPDDMLVFGMGKWDPQVNGPVTHISEYSNKPEQIHLVFDEEAE